MHKRLELKRAGGPEAADPFLTTPLHPNGSVLSVSDMVAEHEEYTSQNQKNTFFESPMVNDTQKECMSSQKESMSSMGEKIRSFIHPLIFIH